MCVRREGGFYQPDLGLEPHMPILEPAAKSRPRGPSRGDPAVGTQPWGPSRRDPAAGTLCGCVGHLAVPASPFLQCQGP